MLNLFGIEVKLTSYADDKHFFLRNLSSLKAFLKAIENLERVSFLKLNLKKSEICCIGEKMQSRWHSGDLKF